MRLFYFAATPSMYGLPRCASRMSSFMGFVRYVSLRQMSYHSMRVYGSGSS